MRPSRGRRLLFSLAPLGGLLVLVELGASLLADRALASRALALPESGLGAYVPDRADPDGVGAQAVVCIGDSWTFGVGVPAESAYPAQLEALLRERRGLDVNVINLGEPGATPLHAARRLNQYLQGHRAAVVLALFGSNTDYPESLDPEMLERSPLLRLRPLLNRLTSYKLLVQLVARGKVTGHTVLSSASFTDKPEPFAGQGAPPPPQNAARELTDAQLHQDIGDNVARMDDLASAVGAELMLLTYAIPGDAQPQELGTLPRANVALREVAAARGLRLVELESLYARHQTDNASMILGVSRVPNRRDLHPSAAGYALYAEELADALGERLD